MKQTKLAISAALSLALLVALPLGAADDSTSFSHDPVRQDKESWVAVTENGSEKIEDLTAYCTDCHADMESNSKQNAPSPSPGIHSHPVDQPYPENGTDLVPLAELDKRFLLIDGAITCITCHVPDAPDCQLIIPDASGKLCISCHKK